MIILNTDSYKASHWLQYPPNTEKIYSYIESRGGEFKETKFAGMQMFIKEYLTKPITLAEVNEAEEILTMHGEPFNRQGWLDIISKHGGYLPIEIKAAPEGLVIPTKNVLVTVENTDEDFAWLTSYIEPALLRAVWYPTTVATISWRIKNVIRRYMQKTSEDPSNIQFKLHDFGPRGVSSMESSAIGGVAHLMNFLGTDNLVALVAIRKYFSDAGVAGFSVPAAEHSSITSWGRENEKAAYENMITQFGGLDKIVAVVSDSYDLENACKLWGQLKDKIVESGTLLVVRPDSGNPSRVVLQTVRSLDREFGSTINSLGYRVLNNVRVIQGDGINENSIESILAVLAIAGYSADNVSFGMGGALLQQMNRDTLKFAMKASAAKVAGEWRDVQKDPITDPGKRSKKGRVTLFRVNGEFVTDLVGSHRDEVLRPVFRDGKLLIDESFETIRNR
jgi:nicotinamide phosphoribosyltransferase